MFRGKMWLIGQLSVPIDRPVAMDGQDAVGGMLLVKIDFYGVIVGAVTHNGSEIRPLNC